jgi:Uma2 family endonuclease
MATDLQQALITAEEFETMSFEFPTDLVQGEIVPMPPPGGIHGRVCGNVFFALETWARGSDLGTVTANDSAVITERNPDSVRGCDVMFTNWKRLPDRQIPKGAFRTAPDLVVEVQSPSDRWRDVMEKVGEYLDVGVTEIWVVDPEDRSVDVFRNDRKQIRLSSEQTLTSADVLPGFSCQVSEFFRHV